VVVRWDLAPIQHALSAGLLPVIYGDVIFDEARGGTILSTEELFFHLAPNLRPERILIAGREAGVWADFPARTNLAAVVDRPSFELLGAGVGAAEAADVTGGMGEKVRLMLDLCDRIAGLQARIFSGEAPDGVARALCGEPLGTLIRGK
jgi:isopentenyl phosphate kinase